MPVINVSLTKPVTKEQKEKLILDLTKRTFDLLQIPPEKISVVIEELSVENYGRGGYTENHSNFGELSRKLTI